MKPKIRYQKSTGSKSQNVTAQLQLTPAAAIPIGVLSNERNNNESIGFVDCVVIGKEGVILIII